VAVVGLIAAWSSGQAVTEKPLLAEQAFKNIVVFRGIPADEFMDTMGMFSAALTLTCSGCHVLESLERWDKYADDTPIKQTARRMVLMVNSLNKNSGFRQGRTVTCWTCHHSDQIPESTPSLAIQYETPVEDPNEVFDLPGRGAEPGTPTVDQIFDRYIQAIGGTQRVSGLTSIVGKGNYEGYDTEHEMVPFEYYAKAPNQFSTVIRYTFEGHNDPGIKTYDGRNAWVASPNNPIPLMSLTGGNLEGVRIDAMLNFPAQIKPAFTQWQVSTTTIGDADVYIIQGTATGKPPVKLYFDQKSSLLVRLVRYSDTLAGRVPTQLDFADYRDVSGVKIPFHLTTTWTNGLSNVELTEVQVNVPIDAAKFAKPAPVPVYR
jgi:hypothetical protein